jgi:hypothetical protein
MRILKFEENDLPILCNYGLTCFALGELEKSRKIFQETLKAVKKEGDKAQKKFLLPMLQKNLKNLEKFLHQKNCNGIRVYFCAEEISVERGLRPLLKRVLQLRLCKLKLREMKK